MVNFTNTQERHAQRRDEVRRTKHEVALDRLRDANPIGRLRVEPVDAAMREHLRHPSHARHGPFQTEWPDDTFTYRRLRDGDIKLAEDQRNA